MKISELPIPLSALAESDPEEFIRMWIAGGDAHTSLKLGVFGEFELESWGMMLADIARQVVTAYQDKNNVSAEAAYQRIASGYTGRLSEKVNSTVKPLTANN